MYIIVHWSGIQMIAWCFLVYVDQNGEPTALPGNLTLKAFFFDAGHKLNIYLDIHEKNAPFRPFWNRPFATSMDNLLTSL